MWERETGAVGVLGWAGERMQRLAGGVGVWVGELNGGLASLGNSLRPRFARQVPRFGLQLLFYRKGLNEGVLRLIRGLGVVDCPRLNLRLLTCTLLLTYMYTVIL